MARATKAAVVVESTPPETAAMTVAEPTCFLIFLIKVSRRKRKLWG